jgi:hypothetical protein
MLGMMEDWQRRLSVNLVWGRSRSQRLQGKAEGRLVMARNWDLKVWMARLAALRQWTFGGTSWYCTFHVSSMVDLNLVLTLLLRIWRSMLWPRLVWRLAAHDLVVGGQSMFVGSVSIRVQRITLHWLW